MEASQIAYDVTSPLLRQVPQSALDAVFGAAALVSPDLKLAVVGRTWDEFMARSGRGDLGRNAMLGSSILLFFRNDEQRRVFESLLHSMHSDELGVHNQVVDLGTKDKPFYVQIHVQGLWQEGVFAGYFVHCLDITREHANRLALIERDREMLSGRETAEKSLQQTSQLQEKLRAALEEVAQREAQLKKMTEKSVRLEKTSKEALERAEKSIEKSSRIQHELDKLKKQHSDHGKLESELESRNEVISKLSTELKAAQETAAELHRELKCSREQFGEQVALAAEASQEVETLHARLDELSNTQQSAANSQSELAEKLAQSELRVKELLSALEEVQQSSAKQVAELKAALADSQSSVDAKTSELKSALKDAQTAAEKQVAELRSQLEAVQESAAESKSSTDEQTNELKSALKEVQTTAAKQLAELKAQLDAAQKVAAESKSGTDEQTNALKSALKEVQTAAAKQMADMKSQLEAAQKAAVEAHSADPGTPASDELLSYISQRACYLDPSGNLLCATGAFWEKIGAVQEQSIGAPFAKWLGDDQAEQFSNWLENSEEPNCEVIAPDGTAWKAWAITDDEGNLVAVNVEEIAMQPEPVASSNGMIAFAPQSPSQVRVLSRELADEFSNLLTGVLGHASLAAAEHDGTPSHEIVAIEKSAREAAHLVRKLSALGGHGRHGHENDLAATTKQYVKKLQPDFYPERAQLVLCEEACKVFAEANSLRTVLEMMSSHVRDNLTGRGQVCYTLSTQDEQACLSLSYDGEPSHPAGWEDGLPPTMGARGWDLVFAREVVRGMGGELELSENSGRSVLLMTLPLIPQGVQA
jgi:hypothetical protein